MLKKHLNTYKKYWQKDIIAGLSVSFIAIPQAIAYAAIAGLPPHVGLYAGSIPTVLAAVFGTSRILTTGPTAVMSLLTASVLGALAITSESGLLVAAMLLAVTVGIIQVALGATKLSSFINFIAHPVLIGFTTAAAIIIGFSQTPKVLGIDIGRQPHFYDTVIEVVQNIQNLDPVVAMFGIGSLITLAVFRIYWPKAPGALIVIAGSIVLSWLSGYAGPIVGKIPQGFMVPQFTGIPDIPFQSFAVSAAVIAVVGFTEGISVIKSLSQKTRDKIDPNREMLAQGVANISAGLIGSYPVAGSVSRTALNLESGAKSKAASIYLGLITLLSIFLIAPLLFYLAHATLAAVIIIAVMGLVKLDKIKEFIDTRPRDGFVAVVTLIATLAFAPHLDYGIIAGIIASIVAHLHRSANPRVDVFLCHDKSYIHAHHYQLRTYPTNKKVLGVSIESSLNFTNASHIHNVVLDTLDKKDKSTRYVLIMANAINHIDASAEEVLHELHDELQDQGIQMLLSGLKPSVEEELKKTELYDFIGGENIYARANYALRAINRREKHKK